MPPGPVVTILVPSYNYAHYMGQTLQSVLEQHWQNFEVLVVDDGSTDGSLALAHRFAAKDARVRVCTHPGGRHYGLPATLALGLAEARGQVIAFLEADDLWHPQCLCLRMEVLVSTGAGVVFNDIEPIVMPGVGLEWFDGYVRRVMRDHAARARRTQGAMHLPTEFLTENLIPTFSCAMARTHVLRACSWQPPVPRWLDWWIWAQLSQKTSFAFVPAPLTRWRLHTASLHNAIALRDYTQDYRAQWRGFGRQLAPEADACAARLLRMPYWTRLAARFWVMTRQRGVTDTLGRAAARLGWWRSRGLLF